MQVAHESGSRSATGPARIETKRLVSQSAPYNPVTRRVLGEAGIKPGMRVLDLGTGAGDVALLAAELVGPDGSVTGIDRDPAVLETARGRARSAGLTNITFVPGDLRDPVSGRGFDAVIGRFVLVYVPDPALALREVCRQLKPGGIVAFQEFNFTTAAIGLCPPTPLWAEVGRWLYPALRGAGADPTMGYKLYRTFGDAGFPEPLMHLDAPIGGGPAFDGHEFVVETLRGLLPIAERLGIATAARVDIETLADRLRAETAAAHGVVRGPDLVSAWTRLA